MHSFVDSMYKKSPYGEEIVAANQWIELEYDVKRSGKAQRCTK